MNVKITQSSESACESTIRGHHLKCDRPQEKAGGNEGPMGGEYFLMGLGVVSPVTFSLPSRREVKM